MREADRRGDGDLPRRVAALPRDPCRVLLPGQSARGPEEPGGRRRLQELPRGEDRQRRRPRRRRETPPSEVAASLTSPSPTPSRRRGALRPRDRPGTSFTDQTGDRFNSSVCYPTVAPPKRGGGGQPPPLRHGGTS